MKSEILKHFEDMEDPRVVGRTIHPLRNIVFITVVGALCGLTGWEEIADFAKYRKGFFSRYLDISMGLPCEDTLRRFSRNSSRRSSESVFSAGRHPWWGARRTRASA
jgi:hypothetical protein